MISKDNIDTLGVNDSSEGEKKKMKLQAKVSIDSASDIVSSHKPIELISYGNNQMNSM